MYHRIGGISRLYIACEPKRRYATWAAALTAARMVNNAHHVRQDPYACKLCGGFHTGESRQRECARRPRLEPTIEDELAIWADELDRYVFVC